MIESTYAEDVEEEEEEKVDCDWELLKRKSTRIASLSDWDAYLVDDMKAVFFANDVLGIHGTWERPSVHVDLEDEEEDEEMVVIVDEDGNSNGLIKMNKNNNFNCDATAGIGCDEFMISTEDSFGASSAMASTSLSDSDYEYDEMSIQQTKTEMEMKSKDEEIKTTAIHDVVDGSEQSSDNNIATTSATNNVAASDSKMMKIKDSKDERNRRLRFESQEYFVSKQSRVASVLSSFDVNQQQNIGEDANAYPIADKNIDGVDIIPAEDDEEAEESKTDAPIEQNQIDLVIVSNLSLSTEEDHQQQQQEQSHDVIVSQPPNYLTEEEIEAIAKIEGNEYCVDCGAGEPKWASINYGTLLCVQCSSVHRSFGVHISFVRSLQLDQWKNDTQTIRMLKGGNKQFNKFMRHNGYLEFGHDRYMSHIAERYQMQLLSSSPPPRTESSLSDQDQPDGSSNCNSNSNSASRMTSKQSDSVRDDSDASSTQQLSQPIARLRLAEMREGGLYHRVRPRWQPDSEAKYCSICDHRFSFLFRRHHCRCCGKVVCENCAPALNSKPLPALKYSKPVRHCKACYKSPFVDWSKMEASASISTKEQSAAHVVSESSIPGSPGSLQHPSGVDLHSPITTKNHKRLLNPMSLGSTSTSVTRKISGYAHNIVSKMGKS